MAGRGGGDIVVVAARDDLAAVALVTLLRRRGRRALLADERAIVGAVLEHRPASGPPDADHPGIDALPGDLVRLPDGYPIGAGTGLVVWRLDGFPVARLPLEHREYAECEGFAAGLSWLTGLGDRVLNRPDPLCLAGARTDLLRLHRLAGEFGLAVPRFQLRTSDAAAGIAPDGLMRVLWETPGLPEATGGRVLDGPRLPRPVLLIEPVIPERGVLVLDDQVVGPQPAHPVATAEALAALVKAAGLRCAQVAVGRSRTGRLLVTGLAPVPQLAAPAQLDAFADYVERRALSRMTEVAA